MDCEWQVLSLGKSESLTQPIKVHLSPNFTVFSEFCVLFLKYPWNCEHLKTKMSLIADIFPKL